MILMISLPDYIGPTALRGTYKPIGMVNALMSLCPKGLIFIITEMICCFSSGLTYF